MKDFTAGNGKEDNKPDCSRATGVRAAVRVGHNLSCLSLCPPRPLRCILMPERPERETVVRDLRPLLTGRTITGVRQSQQKLRRPWEVRWNAAVAGSRIEGLRRRGKWILIDLADGRGKPGRSPDPSERPGLPRPSAEPVLRVHLGMSGQFTVVAADEPEPDHLHVVFALDNGTELRLRDPR